MTGANAARVVRQDLGSWTRRGRYWLPACGRVRLWCGGVGRTRPSISARATCFSSRSACCGAASRSSGRTTVLVRGAPLPFQIFGLAFVVVGLYFIAGRFLAKARRKRRTVYGLTRDRALVAVGPGSFSEVPLAQVPIEQSRSRDGRHLTVVFGRWAGGWLTGPSYANTGMEFFGRDTAQVGFYDVSDVGGLEAALHSLRG